MNGLPVGPWRAVGERAYLGMELDAGSGYMPFDMSDAQGPPGSGGALSGGWKQRCELFHRQVPSFGSPFSGMEISSVEHPDEVAYCRCRLRTDLLAQHAGRGIYVEVEVNRNSDNLSLAVVDFEGGGRSSVTFSPETGAVLRERKVRESPRAIEGTYIHLLPAAPAGRRFEGSMGLYLRDGHLAFFRRWSGATDATATASSGPASSVGATAVTSPTAGDEGDEEASDRSSTVGASASSGSGRPTGDNAPEALPIPLLLPDAAAGWETTGFCTDLRWAQGPRLSICLAFRDDGPYRVRIAQVGRNPPCAPDRSKEAYQEDKWSLLYGDDDHPLAI